MRMLDIAQPVAIADIYTDVNVLEEITSQQWREIDDLLQGFNPELDNFDRFGLGKRLNRIPALDAVLQHSKLMVLGKPGAGKTTLLQWIAIKCDRGELQSNRVPIFIWLKNFAEDTRRDDCEFRLLNYISEEFVSCGADKSVLETILTQGKALILLDGLDEVLEEDGDEVVRQIRRFTDRYFKNQFIITCRIAAQKYRFQAFTDVEVADFNPNQVEVFAKKWFIAVAKNNQKEGKAKSNKFIENLYLPKNKQIRELAVTPILLNLTCLVFQAKSEFPTKHSKLYEQGLGILLERWDESRDVKRDEAYRNLSLEEKKELLSDVAFITFERGNYLFDKDQIQQLIADYLCTLPTAKTEPKALKQDSNAALKSIETQHGLLIERYRGIYSFSHLSFQEYFTAKAIVDSSDSEVLKYLVSHVFDKRWREVFLLVASMLKNVDILLCLMKSAIDAIVAGDENLQQFLAWVSKTFCSVSSSHKPAALRSQYLEFRLYETIDFTPASMYDVAQAFDLTRALNPTFDQTFNTSLDPEQVISQSLEVNVDFLNNLYSDQIGEIEQKDLFEGLLADILDKAAERQQILQQLENQLPEANLTEWLMANDQSLRDVLMGNCNISQNWHFSEEQLNLLRQYRDGNLLLVNCLNNSEVSTEVRQEIEDNLLLTFTEI
jgi:predicted NACHT family NTPase